MKLAASNIAWPAEQDQEMYAYLAAQGYQGIEIAPTRILPQNPYDCRAEAGQFARSLREHYGLQIVSMQSIWYGRQENIFRSKEERQSLLSYTKKAILFAESMDCPNIVFGCPKNRNRAGCSQAMGPIHEFFAELGRYAAEHGTVLAIEANPEIYQTDFLNRTAETKDFICGSDAPGLALNLDVGTMLANKETISEIEGIQAILHHVHISEPWLAVPQKRELHKDLAKWLKAVNYDGFISLEMKNPDIPDLLRQALQYVTEVFGHEG